MIDACTTDRCVYDEAIDLSQLGELTIRRASHVEPDDQGLWWADLARREWAGPRPFHAVLFGLGC